MSMSYKSIWLYIFIFFSFFSMLFGCENIDTTPISDTGFYFDTAVTITLYGKDKKQYIDECFEICEYYENLLSIKIDSSDISLINSNSKLGISTIVNKDTLYLIEKSLDYSKLSEGKFDISIGALSTLWNFTVEYPVVPNSSQINQCLSTVDYKNIQYDYNEKTVLLSNKDTIIDVGGIAKGFIADKLKEYLSSKGIQNAIINLGGNIVLLNAKPDGTAYNIGIQKPFGGRDDTIATVRTTDKSIVSSGVYERYFYQDEILYHHILDTENGYPVQNNLFGVTILSDSSIDGDALSTTCFALGLVKGQELIESLENVEAIFIDDEYNLILSSGLNRSDNIITIKY